MLTLFALLGAAQAAPAGPIMPDWMAGCWEQVSGTRWTEECWSSPRGALMIGYSRSGRAGTVTEWEVMQIVHSETDDPAVPWMTFAAAPQGVNRTTFAWVPSREPGLTFVNLANDYPQRIRYWREGKALVAEIALGDGSKPRRWRYQPKVRPPVSPQRTRQAPSARSR